MSAAVGMENQLPATKSDVKETRKKCKNDATILVKFLFYKIVIVIRRKLC